MKSSHDPTGIGRNLLIACVLGCLLPGCSVVGPTAISNGRLAYNEAIIETNNQQQLMALIRNRYEERGNLLAVASVTANVRIRTSTGVPFSAGAVYEENPTISYTPVTGEKYTERLFAPIPVTTLAQFTGTLTKPAPIYTALVASVNGIQNPDFLFSPADQPDPRFSRFVTLMTELGRAHRLHWVEEDPRQAGSFSVLIIDHYAPPHAAKVSELLALLGLSAPKERSPALILPASLTLDGRDMGGIGITTRSVWDLVEILSAAIEVPEKDQQNGVAASYPPPGLVGSALRIHSAETRPKHAYVTVKHRDWWFYIDERDQATKGFFRLLSTLWSIAIAESTAKGAAAPVLTVPVSR